MSLSTEQIKVLISQKFPLVNTGSLKRTSKRKNDSSEVVRTFSSNIGTIIAISDPKDENIISLEHTNEGAPITNKKSSKYENYYFCVGDKVEYDKFMKKNFLHVCIVPKKYWDKNQCVYDQPLSIENFLYNNKIESPNETGDFVAFDYPDNQSLITFLESVGMKYNNDLAQFCIQTSYAMYLKP